ncbi:hypothetical protein FLLO111716_01085 [Flavobacterium longum]
MLKTNREYETTDLNFDGGSFESNLCREDVTQKDSLMNRKEAARYLNFKPNTLAVWDCTRRYDLKPIKIGRSVRYRKSVLDQFLLTFLTP